MVHQYSKITQGSLTEPEDFILKSESPGYKYCPDTTNVGADISLVGIIGEGSPPASPTDLRIISD